jgi:hypothetical protein
MQGSAMRRPQTPVGLPDRPKAASSEGPKEPLQVRIPRDIKRRFKAHAAMRGLAPHELFVEVWEYYERGLP